MNSYFPEPTEEQIAELKNQHDEIHELEANGVAVIVRNPTRQEYRRFKEMGFDNRKRADCVETLFMSALVYPEKKVMSTVLDKQPGLAETFGNKVLELAGVLETATSKKL